MAYFKVCGTVMGGITDQTAKKKNSVLVASVWGRISIRDILKKKKLGHTKNFKSACVASSAVIHELPIIFDYV